VKGLRTRRRVATPARRSYPAGMSAPRFLRILTMFAVVLMPFGMLGGASAAMAMSHHGGAAMTMDHCAGMDKQQKKEAPGHTPDCMVTCAAIPSTGGDFEHQAMTPAAIEPLALAPPVHGLHPEAATPPPRFS
jgi:hypothetical protein